MTRALSTHLLVEHRLNTAWLDRISAAGIPMVEIFCARQHFDYRNRAQVSEIAYWFADTPLKLHSLHSPMFNDDCWGRTGPASVVDITELSKPKRIEHVDEIKRAIEVAESIPFSYLIQHLGGPGQEYDEHRIEAAFKSLDEIQLFAAHRGVKVLLENIPNALSSAERLMHFLELTHLDLGFCFDTGHAHLMESVEGAFSIMAPRIRSTHIHDNDGESDLHLRPCLGGEGGIDWKRVMELLRSRADQYPLLLELKDPGDPASPLDAACEVFDKLENQ